jgi:hypothetical protein
MASSSEQAYERLVADLSGRGVTAGDMFGKPTLKVGTKSVACLYNEGMAFKLGTGTSEHAEALALSGANVFDPSGTGREMQDWVWVPVEHAKHWVEFADAAVYRLIGQPPATR